MYQVSCFYHKMHDSTKKCYISAPLCEVKDKMLAIEICKLSIEIKDRCNLNGAKNEEDRCWGADRGSKGFQTTWLLLLIAKLIYSIHDMNNARINSKEAFHHCNYQACVI